MIEKIEFPEGVNWTIGYVTGADFLGNTAELPSAASLYRYVSNKVADIKFDITGNNCSRMFEGSAIKIAPFFDTSKVTNMSYMFSSTSISTIPQYDTSNVTNMTYMFNSCGSLKTIPDLNTPKVTNMSYMFNGCQYLEASPQLDMSNVTNMAQMFYNCQRLKTIPDLNTVKAANFGTASYSTWLYGCTNLASIGVIDCDSITNIAYALGSTSNSNLKHLGGFRNLGKASSVSNTNSSYFLNYAPNLTYESVMNVLNLLYDRASAGLSVLTLKLHTKHMAMLSDDDKAIATNKGWTLA